MDIGLKIKEARSKKGMTLKDLSEKSGLSVGFLSQLERGMTTIAVDSLEKIADILSMSVTDFFEIKNKSGQYVLRSYERPMLSIQEGGYISYLLSSDLQNKSFMPKLVEVLPVKQDENTILYKHDGEEFIFVLEGILTVYIDNQVYDLYPGDSAHFSSEMDHNWCNHTNKSVRILTVNTPNYLSEDNMHG